MFEIFQTEKLKFVDPVSVEDSCLILTPDYLPADFLPLSVVPWQTCIRLMFLDKIVPVHLYEDRFIRSTHMAVQLPAVAVTREKFAFKSGKVRFTRHLMMVRDLYQCAYCGEEFPARQLTVDHVIPKNAGGKTRWDNCVTSCHDCNTRKGHKLWTPNYKPYAPDYYTLAARRLQLPINISHESWIQYLRLGNQTATKPQLRKARWQK